MKKPRRRVLLTIQKCLNRNKSSKRCCRFGAKLSVKIFTRLFCFEQVFNTEIFIQHSQLQERMILAHSPLAQHTVTDDSMQILLNLTGLAPHEPKQIQRTFVDSSEQNRASISETICLEILVFGQQTIQMLFYQNILTNPLTSEI